MRRPLVRPRFLKWSLVVFALLTPFVVYTIWDYVETRRYDDLLARVDPNHELTDQHFRAPAGLAADSERQYRAAAALVSAFPTENSTALGKIAAAVQADNWSQELEPPLREVLQEYDEALALADRAAELPFEGFSPGTAYSLRASHLWYLQRLNGYRAMLGALDGDANAAVEALYTGARIERTYDRPQQFGFGRTDFVQVLERIHPSKEALRRLERAVNDGDRDDGLEKWYLGIGRNMLWRPKPNAYLRHILYNQIDVLSRLTAASHAPWPERIDRLIAVGHHLGNTPKGMTEREFLEVSVLGDASRVAVFRCAHVVVAVERYRREHGEELPATVEELTPDYLTALAIDPFSGKSLLLKKTDRGYIVYSVGRNRQDDGGNISERPAYLFPKQYPADIGVEVRYH